MRRITDEDDVLIRKIVHESDASAFEALVVRHTPGIRRILYGVLNGNREDMQDAEQEILIGLYRNLHRFGFRSTFRTWLYTFARNRAVDHLRKVTRQRRIAERAAGETEPAAADPESRALDSIEDQRALKALGTLKEEQRSLIIMKDLEDLSIAEISELTGLAVGTVKSRLHRAREKLVKMMGGGDV